MAKDYTLRDDQSLIVLKMMDNPAPDCSKAPVI